MNQHKDYQYFNSVYQGNATKILPTFQSETFQTVITSPPYWGLRDYEHPSQIGLENSLDDYLKSLEYVFLDIYRVLKNNGTLWLNIGDSYTSGNRKYRAPDKKNPNRANSFRPDNPEGLKNKELLGLPWRLAFILQKIGFHFRCDIVWQKPNGMPESVKDRPMRSHEYVLLFSKSENYKFNSSKLPKEFKKSVWCIGTSKGSLTNGAVFPQKLVQTMICASTDINDLILDPFFGVGTVGFESKKSNRKFTGIELNKSYIMTFAEAYKETHGNFSYFTDFVDSKI